MVTLVRNGKNQVVPGLSLSGIESTLNRSITISGTTSDTREFLTYQVIVLGDSVYLKGLTGVAGVDPQQWYTLPTSVQAGVRRLPTAHGLLASFDPQEFAGAGFSAAGNQGLDDEECSIWSAKQVQFVGSLLGISQGSDLQQQLGTVDNAEVKIWICADGFIHLVTGEVNGHDAKNQADTTAVSLRFAMADFDQALAIQAPANVKPFPTPPPTGTPGATPAASKTPTSTPPVPGRTETPAPVETTTPPTETTIPPTETTAPPTGTAAPATPSPAATNAEATVTPTP
jgi:hypothetical protein